MTPGADMLLFSGAILFEAAASDAAEPIQDQPERSAPWPSTIPAPPPGVPEAVPGLPWPVLAEPNPIAAEPLAQPLAPLAVPGGDPLPDAPTAPPSAPLPVETILEGLVGTPQPAAPPTPPGAPPPGSGTLDFGALLALLLAPVIEPPQHVGEIPPPFLPSAPIADEAWGLRDWSLL